MSEERDRQRTAREHEDRGLVLRLLAMTAGMFAFGFLMVPLYDVICDIAGINGKTGGRTMEVREAPDTERTVKLEFITSVNGDSRIAFSSVSDGMGIHPGKLYEARFHAENLTDDAMLAQAVPSVVPGQAAKYFQKTDCFCFDQQTFEPGEGREMIVRFIVDPELPPEVDTLSLSYTFFELSRTAADGADEDPAG